MVKSWSELYRGLDTLVRRGDVVANVADDGDVIYRSQEVASDHHRRNQLSVEEVRRLRRNGVKVEQGKGF